MLRKYRVGVEGVTAIRGSFRPASGHPIVFDDVQAVNFHGLRLDDGGPIRLFVRSALGDCVLPMLRWAERWIADRVGEVTLSVYRGDGVQGMPSHVVTFSPCRLVEVAKPGPNDPDFAGLVFVADTLILVDGWRNPFAAPLVREGETQTEAVDRLKAESATRREQAARCKEMAYELPPRLAAKISGWLDQYPPFPDSFRWGRFPLGMVQRWIERAEAAEQRVADEAKVIESLGERLKAALATTPGDVLTPNLMRDAGRMMAETVEARGYHIGGAGPEVDPVASRRLLAGMIRLLAGYLAAEMESPPSDLGQEPGPRAERSAERSEVPPSGSGACP